MFDTLDESPALMPLGVQKRPSVKPKSSNLNVSMREKVARIEVPQKWLTAPPPDTETYS
jgi:hypothetical protein